MTDQPWTIGRLLAWTKDHFAAKGVDSPRVDAEILLAHALGCARIALYTRTAELPADEQRAAFKELVQKRLKGTPVSRLLGRREFFSLDLEVTPDVLVPRPDTEWLVTECLALAKPMESPRLLDLGTGSGCVALALAKQHKTAQVVAVDLSAAALAVARRNAEKHGVEGRIEFLQGDLFAPLPPEPRFGFIVSNPPYVPSAGIEGLSPEVRDHDPRLALDGGPDGFAVIDRILAGAGAFLEEGGWLLCEIGHDQAAEARRRFAAAGWIIEKEAKDGSGHVRVLAARRGLTMPS
ncbi:MAG: peptide chain release factor N(5)-glutamine methyltransferase [Gemmataceae bacterium]|nr:peptide chain release factor N(5)-glutamine methyltransferase [Gemmataceae bacterium]